MKRHISSGQAPAEEERFLRALTQGTSDIVVILDAEGVIRYENSAVERILGYRPEERIGGSAFDHVHEDDVERVKEEFARALERPGPNPPVRFRLRHADGSWRHIETIRNNLLDDPAVRGIVNVSRDVTEREEAEAALKEAEERYRTLVEQVPVAAYSHAPAPGASPGAMIQMPLDYMSPRVEDILGYPAEAFIRETGLWVALIHPDDKERVLAEDVRTDETGDPFEAEYRMRRADGGWTWVRDASTLVRDGEKRPLFWQGVLLDITKRKWAEEKQQASEAELKALFAAMYDIVLVLDRDGRCLRVASANPSLLYKPAQEQIGKTLHEVLPSDKADLLLDRVHHALDTGRTVGVEYSLDIEGRERWFSANVSPMSDDRVVWVAHDATDWKELEAALRESEERYRAVMEQSVEAIYLYDADTRRVLESNAAFQEMVSYTAEELREMRIHDFIAHEPEDVDRNVERSLREKRRQIGERTYRRKDGTEIIVDTSATVISHGGKTALCAVSRDVTERKRLEEALKEREEHFRALIQHAPDTIMILDADATILYDSPSIERVLGYGPEERVGSNGFDYLHPEDHERGRRTFAEVLDNPAVGKPVEYRLRHKDGSWRHFEAIRTNLLDNPAVGGVVINLRDVTERKEAEEKYRGIFENAVSGIFQTSPEGRLISVNPALARMAGYASPEEMISTVTDVGEQIYADSDRRDEFMRLIQGNGSVSHFEFRAYRKDGSIIWVSESARMVHDAGGTLLYYEGFIEDITERRRAEQDLRDSEERHRRLVENSPETIAILSEGKIAFINAAGAKLAGADGPEQLIGRDFLEFVHPDSREAVVRRVAQALDGEATELIQQKLIRPDGSTIEVEAVTIPTTYVGKPAVHSVIRDITERLRAEEELRASEERFRSVVQNSSEVIKIVGIDGALKYASPAFESVFGYGLEEALGTNVLDYVHPEDLPRVREETEKAMNEPGIGRNAVEYRFRHADGSWRHIESVGAYLLDEPSIEGVVINARDVTDRKNAEAELRLRDKVVTTSSSAILITDPSQPDNTIVYANPAFELSTGYSAEEVIGWNCRFLQGEDSDQPALSELRAAIKEERECTVVLRNYRKDGAMFWNELNVYPVHDANGRLTNFVGVQDDITERLRTETELRESEERYRAVVEQSIESIYLFDPQSKRILESNAALEQLLGYTSEELSRMTIYDIVAHPAEDINLTVERHLLEGQRFVGERQYRRKDGAIIEVGVSATVIPYRDGEAVCAVARDVTEQKALQEQLAHQAFHDSLTGLPNRALFLDRLDHALSRVRRVNGSVAVLFVDLDDFKSINDSLGHEAGDRLLGEVARRIRSSVRPGDTVGRLFGDEFGVLLDAPAEVEEARQVTERVMERLQEPFHLDGREVFVHSSIGIASGPSTDDPEKEQPKDVLHRADLAMYAAKSSGKGQYEIFNPSMNIRAVERMELKNELRRAVEREEFEVHYQPLIETHTGKVAGLEALARWRHPERGLVAAEEFIGLAEETGLVHPMGGWVFEQVCAQARRWTESGLAPPFLMGVNFSAGQFAHQADMISRVLGETGLEPGSLIVEITERAVMDNAEFALGKLKRLKGLGVKFAIDDYGTGYSCLRYLKLMPVDFLKIDRMFIAGLGQDAGDEAIVHGTIDLAHALGLKVVAEGVETADQLERLKELKCDLVQGFYLSYPLPEPEASALLAKGFVDPRG